MKIQFLEPAEQELHEAITYYNHQMIGLGDSLLEEVIKCIDRIVEFPNAWHPFSKNTRRIRTKRFPYGVIYHIDENEILIVAIAHLHRKPDYWKDRF